MAETELKTSTVSVPTFGKLFSRTVDGDLYAQPLVVCGVGDPKRNVVYLATSRNWIYAYDADDPDDCLPIWSRNLGQPVPRDDIFINYLNFANQIGITSTPVIDLDGQGGGTMYVVPKIRAVQAGVKQYTYVIQAIDIVTGLDRPITKQCPASRVVITATAARADGTTIVFDPLPHLNRPGLLLVNGVLYLAFGSHGDQGDFYGWIMAYDAQTLEQLAVYNAAPDWGQGGIWQSGTGLAADRDGFIYAVVGNGESPDSKARETPPVPVPVHIDKPVYGNAILKMRLARDGAQARLEVVDWFTASNTMQLNQFDNDFIGGPVLFDVPPVPGSSGRLIIGGGKDGKIYLADRMNLGQWKPLLADGTPDVSNILQAEELCTYHIHGAPVIWENSHGEVVAFVWSEKDFLKALKFNGKTFDPHPTSTSVYGFPEDELRMPGGILALSANGDEEGSAIVWASHPTDDDGMNQTVLGTLRAYDARDLNNELWNSDMDAEGTDRVGSFAKFCPPVVANGKVYLATFSRELVVYGLFADVGRKPRSNDCGIFRLQAISHAGSTVQQSGNYTCNHYDLRITGAGIGDDEDSFLYAFVARDSEEESEISITTRVDGINAPEYHNPYVGVMIRKFGDTTPDPAAKLKAKGDPIPPIPPNATRFAAVVVNKDGDVLFLHRDADKAKVRRDGPRAITFPCYVRLTAKKIEGMPGFVDFIGEYSADGIDWERVSALQQIQMAPETSIKIDGKLMVGLVTSAQLGKQPDTTTDQAHAKFSNVRVVPAFSRVTAAPPMD
jgi:outer membrane protein assembly factor BamB